MLFLYFTRVLGKHGLCAMVGQRDSVARHLVGVVHERVSCHNHRQSLTRDRVGTVDASLHCSVGGYLIEMIGAVRIKAFVDTGSRQLPTIAGSGAFDRSCVVSSALCPHPTKDTISTAHKQSAITRIYFFISSSVIGRFYQFSISKRKNQ